MHSLPTLVDFDLRPAAWKALADLRPHLPEEDRQNGIFWGLYALIDDSFDCPGNLLRLDEDWTWGPANDSCKKRACMWQQAKAFQLAYYRRYDNPDAFSGFDRGSRDRRIGRKGGAIIFDVRIPETGDVVWTVLLSAAGTNEAADETFVLRVARIANWELVHPEQLDQIAAISKNPFYEKLRAAA